MKRTISTFAVLFVVFLMGLAQSMDFVDQVNADRVYCEAVRDGEWSDYKSMREDCPVILQQASQN